MNLKILKKEQNLLIFTIDKINPPSANTLRRYAMNFVPTLAIEEVKIVKNNSALFDEMLAHRLGLLPLKTSLSGYSLPQECKCEGKGCAKCQCIITCSGKGPSTLYAEQLVSKDEDVKPIYPKMPIVKLLKGQEVKFEAKAVLGRGKEHTKFSPCLIYYRGYPEIYLEKNSDAKGLLQQCQNIVQKGAGLEIKDILQWNEGMEDLCNQHGVLVKNSQEKFLFTLESWGSLDPKHILIEAVKVFEDRLKTFEKLVAKL